MSDPTFVDGWNKGNHLEDIRRSRTEIELIHMFNVHNKNGTMNANDLIKKCIETLDSRYNFKADVEYTLKRLNQLVKVNDLARGMKQILIYLFVESSFAH